MAEAVLLHLRRRSSSPSARTIFSYLQQTRSTSNCTSAHGNGEGLERKKGRWFTLPPFDSHIDPSSVGKEMVKGKVSRGKTETTTALKWVRRCFPGIPVSLVQKLFRLRQVRIQVAGSAIASPETEVHHALKRVSAKDAIGDGDVILLPISVQKSSPEKVEKGDYCCNEDEINYMRSLELYKDTSIIVLNKPHGMPVQGGIGIKLSLDTLASSSLRYDCEEPPRLVHRLDRDSSGILVLGRTQTSASILHSIFREKTFEASTDVGNAQRILQRKYWALVIGIPRRSKGIISAPLAKVVLENGKSERITICNNNKSLSSQVALTEYKVIGSSDHGYSWLELCPLTGRKHQLRVHCAEVLGTPIVGDYKYGWHAHRKWEPVPCLVPSMDNEKLPTHNLPFGLELEGGSISHKHPRFHLHCRQMILPDISAVLRHLQSSDSNHDFSKIQSLDLVAPLPSHMQRSWDVLKP